MLFISLSSFRLTRTLAAFVLGIGFNAAACLAQPVYSTVRSTPYDRQMNRVVRILNWSESHEAGLNSLTLVNYWIMELRAMPYCYSKKWRTPSEGHRNPV